MKNFFAQLFAPFIIVKREKLYIGWIVYAVIFGMINLIADMLMGKLENLPEYIKTGQFYTFSIALCAPFIVDILLSIIVEWKTAQKVHFLKYKIASILFTVILVLIMTFLWLGDFKSIIFPQILCTIFSLCLSYYMFLINHMFEHFDVTETFDDKTYLLDENNRIKEVEEKVSDVNELNMKGETVTL